MAQLVIPGAAQVAIKAECSGQEVVNVIGLNIGGTASAESIAQTVKTAWEKAGGPLSRRPQPLKMISYKVTKLDPNGSVYELSSTAVGGTSSPSIATMASSALIILGGGTRQRSSRGRLYHGPLTESMISTDGRQIEGAYALQLQTAYTQFNADITAAGHSWAVLSRKNSVATPIGQISVASIIATQRRRLR